MKQITNSVTVKFLKSITTVYMLLSILMLAIIIVFEYNTRKTYILNEIESSISAIKKPLSKYVWGYAIEDIDHMKNVLLKNKNIKDIKVLDISKEELTLEKKEQIIFQNSIEKEYKLFFEDCGKKYEVGKVVVYIDKNIVFINMKDFIFLLVGIILFHMLVISMFFKKLFNRCLISPISSITSQIQGLNFKNLKDFKLVSEHKNSEFDYMAYSFNEIIQKLNKSFQKRDEQNRLLLRQSKLASMGEMIGNIAHQWRQPLNNIAALNMKIETKLEFGQQIEHKEYKRVSDKINTQLDYMSKTIDDFTDFFKNNEKNVDFNLKVAMEDVANLFLQSFKNNNIKLKLSLKDIELYGLKNELKQVVINILNNAKDAILSQKESQNDFLGYVSIEFEKSDTKAIITITDNGGGIDEDIIDKIFEPYFTTKFKSKGTGIGLYMSYKIIKEHINGDILVQNKNVVYKNKLYKGTEFIVIVPLVN